MARVAVKAGSHASDMLLAEMQLLLKGHGGMIGKKSANTEDYESKLAHISAAAFVEEQAHVKLLLNELKSFDMLHASVAEKAAALITELRAHQDEDALQSFFQQYPLSSQQGIALMTLAEALLRIPDDKTANDLIHDTLKDIDWSHHGAPNGSLLANASQKGLQLASGIFGLGKAAQAMTDPVIRRFVKLAMQETGSHFVMGESIESALERAAEYEAKGYIFSYDMLGEGARSEKQAKAFYQAYLHSIETLGAHGKEVADLYDRSGISVKLSALYSHYNLLRKEDVYEHLMPRLKAIVLSARKHNVPVTIDAEEANRLDLSLEIFADLLRDKDLEGWNGVGLALQAYQKRAWHVIDLIVQIAQETKHRVPVRLVKGAYWDSEIKNAQMEGLEGYPVYTEKEYTDVSYLACAQKMFAHSDEIYPQFATHNAYSMAAVEELANGKRFEYQLLHGMGQGLYKHVVGKNTPCRIYAPVGPYKELLPYLIRRLLENGANNSFVRIVSDTKTPVDELVQHPVEAAKDAMKRPAPLALPQDIYGIERKNSSGLDLGNISHVAQLRASLKKFDNKSWKAASIVGGWEVEGEHRKVHAPYNRNIIVGDVVKASKEVILTAMDSAHDHFEEWSKTPAAQRAETLNKYADLLELHMGEMIALCMREAGKTVVDAIAEVREAADFARYYASEALDKTAYAHLLHNVAGESNELSLHGRGVFLCISPWNFPLAIFTGQVTAALAAGNCVIAKAADHTTLIAHRAVELMLEAGIPHGVVNLVVARGSEISEHLLTDDRLAGVAFTGSNETARTINMRLAERNGPIIPFIAETGGQNCMIIDSSALLERAVDDVVRSAFGSAGQRCSALRVCYVQEDIADDFCELLAGAMKELKVGGPEAFSTDIGPVIDAEAQNNLEVHCVKMQQEGKLIASAEVDELWQEQGSFVTPHAFEIEAISQLEGEVFGPILHVIRFKLDELGDVIDDINSTGFGLTFGMHSRVKSRVEYVTSRIKAGNHYINRNMIGAVVGQQPFGGEGLSGTGPKAGGPHYLLRFMNERVRTVNTTAIGGDVELLG